MGGLGLFKPTCPALGSGPAENQQETMKEQGLYHFPWCIRPSGAPVQKLPETAELEDVVQCVLDQKVCKDDPPLPQLPLNIDFTR